MANNNKPVFDVSKPNKSAPTTTSRPVITGHTPIMKDPMVSDNTDQEPAEESKPITKTGERVIAPLNKPTATANVTPNTPPPETEQEAEDKKEAAAAVVNAVAEQAGKKKKGEPSKEDLQLQTEIEQMIESKKYFVPIGQVKHRRNRRWFWIFILLVFVMAGIYVAIDANIIDLGIELPYEFIP